MQWLTILIRDYLTWSFLYFVIISRHSTIHGSIDPWITESRLFLFANKDAEYKFKTNCATTTIVWTKIYQHHQIWIFVLYRRCKHHLHIVNSCASTNRLHVIWNTTYTGLTGQWCIQGMAILWNHNMPLLPAQDNVNQQRRRIIQQHS